MGIFGSQTICDRNEEIKVPEITYLSEKRKLFAIAYSFIGTNFHGLQYQDNVDTIENVIFETLISAHLLPPHSMINKGYLKWSQCSRTDAGVHSAGQVLSLMINIDNDYDYHLLPLLLTRHIPSRIQKNFLKFWAVIPIMPAFVAQKMANARRYQYLMPISAFGDFLNNPNNVNALHKVILPEFVGHKNFHNYSTQISHENPYRDIYEFDFSDPVTISGQTFVLWTIHGNSFALNQIRKMIAAVLAYCHGVFSLDDIRASLSDKTYFIKMIPGDGLFLDMVFYTPFLRKFFPKKDPPESNDVEFKFYRPQIEKWKSDILLPHIAAIFSSQDLFGKWIKDDLPHFYQK